MRAISILGQLESFHIYGAGIVAMSTYTAIKHLYYKIPEAFWVSDLEGNPPEVDEIPVRMISDISKEDKTICYIVATPEVHHQAIAEAMLAKGIDKSQLIFLDNELENALMEAYYQSIEGFSTIEELLSGSQKASCKNIQTEIQVFQAKCHVDKPLHGNTAMPQYLCPIQVGAALTEQVVVSLQDNEGDNISEKNRNYCELTASYYAWKNSKADYKGLCHYRRIFDLLDTKVQKLLSNCDVDVILPYPSIYYPNMEAEHNRYVNDSDWVAMLQAMKEVAPNYYDAYVKTISKEAYFYNYNMLIAKREVFDDYCNFLFSVLERTEQLTTPKGWERADRFAGYLGENLTTIYFRKNKEKLKIAHTGKIWLV